MPSDLINALVKAWHSHVRGASVTKSACIFSLTLTDSASCPKCGSACSKKECLF